MAIVADHGLAPDQLALWGRLRDLVLDEPSADAAYDQLPMTAHGRIVSVDASRFLAPEFGTRDGRLRHTPSTRSPAGHHAHERIQRDLLRVPTPAGRPRRLLVTAGGPGSGKTSSLSPEAIRDVDLVFDNQLRDFSRACQLVNEALARGWQIEIMYVHRPFRLAVAGVIDRSERTGRWNRLHELPAMHQQARQTIQLVASRYARHASVHVQAIENAGTPENPASLAPISLLALEQSGTGRYSPEDTLARSIVDEEIEIAKGQTRISAEVLALCLAGIDAPVGGEAGA